MEPKFVCEKCGFRLLPYQSHVYVVNVRTMQTAVCGRAIPADEFSRKLTAWPTRERQG